jgi:uncharacterized membrane protein
MLKNTNTTTIQNILRIILGAFMLFAGISHMTFNRGEFQAQVPDWLPFSKDFVVLASGIVEIVLGLSMIFLKSQRTKVGLALAAFFVLIFPGNISQYINHVDAFGALNSDKARLIRLFFQPVLIAWALWSTGAWKAWQDR